MTLPHGFGQGTTKCPGCGSQYKGFHKEDCPLTKDSKIKEITLPFKPHHINVGIWLSLNFIIIPLLAVMYNPLFMLGWVFFGVFYYLILMVATDNGKSIQDINHVFRFLWNLIPKPHHFGFRIRFKHD